MSDQPLLCGSSGVVEEEAEGARYLAFGLCLPQDVSRASK